MFYYYHFLFTLSKSTWTRNRYIAIETKYVDQNYIDIGKKRIVLRT